MKLLLIFIFSIILYAKVEVLEVVDLDSIKFDNIVFNEISGATYDSKNHILYLVSDKGILYRFRATFDNKVHLKPIDAHYIRRRNGKRVKVRERDVEDIAITNSGNLYVSTEYKPKVLKITKDGVKIKRIKLPKDLENAKLRSDNKSLESLTYNSKYGLLMALELPPKGVKKSHQTIYSLGKKRWRYKSAEVKNSSITAIESIDKNRILVLERAFNGIFGANAITLQLLNLKNGKQRFLWQMDNRNKYMDNFEALAKVGKNRFIIISDDNGNFFQRTLLIYLKIDL